MLDGPHQGLAVAFGGTDESGLRMFLSSATQDPISFDQLAWYERGSLHLAMLAIAYATIASYAITMLLAAAWRAIRKGGRRAASAAEVRSKGLMIVPSVLLTVGPLMALATLLLSSDSGGPRRAIAVGTTLVLGGAVFALASVPLAIVAWSNSYWSPARRVYITVFAVCSIVLAALLLCYHVGPVWI